MWVFRTASSKHTWWLRHHTHCRPTTTFYKKKFQSPLHDSFLRYNIWNGRHRIQLQYVKTNCKFGKNEIYFSINHQPLNYCLMSKIRITNNYKTVLKYCQNEFVVYNNVFFNPHELVVIPLRFFQDNWQTTAQEICYISQHFDRTGFQKNLYIVRFYFFFYFIRL